jgi:anti-anti-sigma regulatory factor
MTTLLTRAPDQPTLPEPAPPVAGGAATSGAVTPARSAAPARAVAPPAVRQLVLTGTLSLSDTSWLEPQLDELRGTGARTLELDLSQVSSMHTAVARLLLRTSWRLGDPQRRLVLLHPRPPVLRVLRFVGARGLVER